MISAIDRVTPVKEGENKHDEYGWSNDLQEKVVQFDFQCVRTDATKISSLATILDGLLTRLSLKQQSPEKESKRKELLTTLYKMIGKTRDIEGGKGEYTLSYMMILTWYNNYPKLATLALSLFVFPPNQLTLLFPVDVIGSMPLNEQVPYGSWKDIKYFCDYAKKHGTVDHPLIQTCVTFINTQLYLDEDTLKNGEQISLAAKWVPRERSDKFGWLFDSLATNYFPRYIESANYVAIPHRELTKKKAINKCRTEYRKLCSKLNKHLDTVQIKQTAKTWSLIEHAKTTSITMAKQRKAFLNKKGSEDPDRIECAENLRTYMESLKKEGKELKGKHVALPDFTKQAQDLSVWTYNASIPGHIVPKSEAADILNSQWRDNGNRKNANGLGSMVAMCDISGSMGGDPLHAAIALSCRVAEKSALGRRVMTFSAEPTWINLDDKVDFTDMVMEIISHTRSVGFNTDFYKALDLILNAIEQYRVPPADVENMILAIFSDMQIDDCLCFKPGSNTYTHSEEDKKKAYYGWSVMHEKIKQKYTDTGMRLYGEPLKPPHILFWNLRSTNGFPTLSTEAGCSMMSGFDPTVLNMFCELGIEALREITPYKNLMKQLENERYKILEQLIVHALLGGTPGSP
jgi:hypothetical protein